MATGESKSKWNGDLNASDSNLHPDGITIQYSGKKDKSKILLTEPTELVKLYNPDLTANKHLILGDNLTVLSHLYHDMNFKDNIKLVYIDPPFATQKVFKSRNRKDAYVDLLTGANYIEFLRERLIFLYELLDDDGSIYVHLDDNMVFQIKILLDEIFGSDNFRNMITRRKCNPKNFTRKQYGNVSDYILFYSKSKRYVWNRAYEAWSEDKAHKEYPYVESDTGRRFKKVPIHAPGERNGATGEKWRDMLPPPGKHWQYTPDTLEQMDKNGEIYWSPTGNPRRKVYLDESQGIPVQDIWLDVKDAHNQNIKITGYPTEKPDALLRRIINASSNEDDLVLDCFSGSGTTLAVASELNRRWIGIDNSLEAIQTILNRFKQGLQPMGDYVNSTSNEQLTLPLFEPESYEFAISASKQADLESLQSIVNQWVGDN